MCIVRQTVVDVAAMINLHVIGATSMQCREPVFVQTISSQVSDLSCRTRCSLLWREILLRARKQRDCYNFIEISLL